MLPGTLEPACSWHTAREFFPFVECTRACSPVHASLPLGGSVCRRVLFSPLGQPSPILALNLKSNPNFCLATFLVLRLQEFYKVLTPHAPGRSHRIRINY